ncbi:MAG: hypothetical protein WC823_03715 [Parcubacteria group bacterium]|jgi:CYTH domain-containing protein
MQEIELEKTYLAKFIPEGALECESREISDLYIPATVPHPILRIRKKGDKFEITKKQPVSGNDSSEQTEDTIILSTEEFNALAAVESKKVRKIRYHFDYAGLIAEIDVFQDELEGLVVVDFEFKTVEAKNSFQMPDFCLADVTQDELIAGGMLCGKSYADIETHLQKYGYNKIMS